MSEEMRKKYKKPIGISEEKWIEYLKAIEDFSNSVLDYLTQSLKKTKKKTIIDDKNLKLYNGDD